jgi:casein kinase 1
MVTIAGGRYRVLRRIGGGAFGEVFVVQAMRTSTHTQEGELLAAKFEPLKSSHQPHLFHEARVYTSIGRDTVTVGIPRVKWYGVEGDYNVLVMDLLGPSLSELLDYCHGRFSLKTVLMLADQMICRLEFVHTCGFLHRDLKPDNFAMGRGRLSHHLYLLDFGLAKRFADVKHNKHIPYRDGKSLTGTARYVSLNTHLGIQQSRRDDIEGLAFVLIYLARGHLPWQNVKCTTKQEKYERIKAMKLATPPSVLCSKLPPCFSEMLTYSRKLDFEQVPDYDYCRRVFSEEFDAQGLVLDYRYSWIPGAASTHATEMSTSSLSRNSSFAAEGGNGYDRAASDGPELGGSGTALSPRSTRRSEGGSHSSGNFSPQGSGIFVRRPMRRASSAQINDDESPDGTTLPGSTSPLWSARQYSPKSQQLHHHNSNAINSRRISTDAHPLDELHCT